MGQQLSGNSAAAPRLSSKERVPKGCVHLCSCDNITISPALLGELAASTEPLPRKLWPEMGGGEGARVDLSASQVRPGGLGEGRLERCQLVRLPVQGA